MQIVSYAYMPWSQSVVSVWFVNLLFYGLVQQMTKVKIFFLFFIKNRIWHFMQIVSLGDNLHKVSVPIF